MSLRAEIEAEPRSRLALGPRRRGFLVQPEQVCDLVRRHADAGVDNLDFGPFAVAPLRHRDGAPFGGKLDRVVDQIADDGVDHVNFGEHRQRFLSFALKPDAFFFGDRREQHQIGVDHIFEVDGTGFEFHPPHLQTRPFEQVFQKPIYPLRGLVHD